MLQDPKATCARSTMIPSQEYQSWKTGALRLEGSAHYWGWSDRPRHVRQPEALPDPALPCVLILLSSASCDTRDGLREESGQKRALNLCFIVLFVRLRKCQGSTSENGVEGASHTQI